MHKNIKIFIFAELIAIMNFQPFIGLLQSLKHTLGLLIDEADESNDIQISESAILGS